jgi:DNA polymerase-3 subunit beta
VNLFPEVPDFAAVSYHVVAASDLKKLIRRTIFATDVESTRYALGGVLVELTESSIAMVGTDGRRLAKMSAPAETENDAPNPPGMPVIPVKALKLIERNLDDDDPPVHLLLQGDSSVLVRTHNAVIYSRLVEGRFPRYQDVFPARSDVKIPIEVGPLRLAVEQASIVTNDESRGVDFSFAPDVLTLASKAADIGTSRIELPLSYDGKAVEITFDPHYLIDALKTLDDASFLTAELIDHKNAAVFKTDDGYSYVVMPLTRDR